MAGVARNSALWPTCDAGSPPACGRSPPWPSCVRSASRGDCPTPSRSRSSGHATAASWRPRTDCTATGRHRSSICAPRRPSSRTGSAVVSAQDRRRRWLATSLRMPTSWARAASSPRVRWLCSLLTATSRYQPVRTLLGRAVQRFKTPSPAPRSARWHSSRSARSRCRAPPRYGHGSSRGSGQDQKIRRYMSARSGRPCRPRPRASRR